MAKDAVESIVDMIRAAAPELPEQKLCAIALRIHRDLGGERLYIPKAPSVGKAVSLGEQIAAGVPLAQAFAAVGVSRSHGFALVSRRWRFRR